MYLASTPFHSHNATPSPPPPPPPPPHSSFFSQCWAHFHHHLQGFSAGVRRGGKGSKGGGGELHGEWLGEEAASNAPMAFGEKGCVPRAEGLCGPWGGDAAAAGLNGGGIIMLLALVGRFSAARRSAVDALTPPPPPMAAPMPRMAASRSWVVTVPRRTEGGGGRRREKGRCGSWHNSE